MVESGYRPDEIDDFHRRALPYLGERFFPHKGALIVDVGAGAGHTLIPLSDAGWKNVVAVDRDDFSRRTFEEKGIRFIHADIEHEQLPFEDASYDAFLSFHVVEHLKDADVFFTEAHRVLRPEGFIVLVTPDWRKQYKTFWRDHTHIHPYDKESIARQLRAHEFEIVEISSFGVFRGFGRLQFWKLFPRFMFTGLDLIAIARRK